MIFWLMIIGALTNLYWSHSLDDPTGEAIFYLAALVCSVGSGIVFKIDSLGD